MTLAQPITQQGDAIHWTLKFRIAGATPGHRSKEPVWSTTQCDT